MTPVRQLQLRRAEATRTNHVTSNPPFDIPWSYFDLAEMRLYHGDPDGSLEMLDKGIDVSTADWQPRTHRQSLELLAEGAVQLPGLSESLERLRTAEIALGG
jgi:hypothetical protein